MYAKSLVKKSVQIWKMLFHVVGQTTEKVRRCIFEDRAKGIADTYLLL